MGRPGDPILSAGAGGTLNYYFVRAGAARARHFLDGIATCARNLWHRLRHDCLLNPPSAA